MLYGLHGVISGSLTHVQSEGLAELTVQCTHVIETMGLWESAVYLCPEKGLPGLPLHEWRWYSEEGHNNTGCCGFIDHSWICLPITVTPALAITEVTREYICRYVRYIQITTSIPVPPQMHKTVCLLLCFTDRQTDMQWPYGQEVMLRQISRVLVATLADWVGVPRSGSPGTKQTTRSCLSPCGDELIGWILAQVKPSATCSLSLSGFTLPPTDSLRGSCRCLSWTTCCLLRSMGFSFPWVSSTLVRVVVRGIYEWEIKWLRLNYFYSLKVI